MTLQGRQPPGASRRATSPTSSASAASLCLAVLLEAILAGGPARGASPPTRAAAPPQLTAINSRVDRSGVSVVIEASEPASYVTKRPEPRTVYVEFSMRAPSASSIDFLTWESDRRAAANADATGGPASRVGSPGRRSHTTSARRPKKTSPISTSCRQIRPKRAMCCRRLADARCPPVVHEGRATANPARRRRPQRPRRDATGRSRQNLVARGVPMVVSCRANRPSLQNPASGTAQTLRRPRPRPGPGRATLHWAPVSLICGR